MSGRFNLRMIDILQGKAQLKIKNDILGGRVNEQDGRKTGKLERGLVQVKEGFERLVDDAGIGVDLNKSENRDHAGQDKGQKEKAMEHFGLSGLNHEGIEGEKTPRRSADDDCQEA